MEKPIHLVKRIKGFSQKVQFFRLSQSLSKRIFVSVVIPNFNYSQYIEECLNSVIESDFDNRRIEIIVIDDASTDNSASIIDSVKKRSKIHINLIRNPFNYGLRKSRNTGIINSRGSYCFLLDSDNYIGKDCIKKHFDFLNTNSDYVACYAPIQKFYNNTKEFGSLVSNEAFDTIKLSSGNYIDAMAMFRKRSLLEIGLYDLKMPPFGWEDWELWLRIGNKNKKVHFLGGEPLAYYRIHGESMLHTTTEENFRVVRSYLSSKYKMNF
ncbi:MAG: glycosyltransferase [Bacteroidales bacterium]|nr:glycosyltransferase [Bacteroidales bacterium]